MSKVSLSRLRDISAAAKSVVSALAGNNEDVHRDNCTGMVQLYDHLNDVAAPPAVVKAIADELINLREENERLRKQRIADRRRLANPAPESILKLVSSALAPKEQ